MSAPEPLSADELEAIRRRARGDLGLSARSHLDDARRLLDHEAVLRSSIVDLEAERAAAHVRGFIKGFSDAMAADTPIIQAAQRVVDAFDSRAVEGIRFALNKSQHNAVEALAAAFTEEPAAPKPAVPFASKAERDEAERRIEVAKRAHHGALAGEPAAPPEPEPTFYGKTFSEWHAAPEAER